MKYATLLLGAALVLALVASFTPARAETLDQKYPLRKTFEFLKDMQISLPPAKYDFPFKGKLFVWQAPSREHLHAFCNVPESAWGPPFDLACSFPNQADVPA